MIVIKKSPTADTRACDWSTVTREQLLLASEMHISDVRTGLDRFAELLQLAGRGHDADKIDDIDGFHADFKTGFTEHTWLDRHYKNSRHHLDRDSGVPQGVDLLDILEHIVDCVMAGMARSGDVYPFSISDELLRRAFNNTVELLKGVITVESE